MTPRLAASIAALTAVLTLACGGCSIGRHQLGGPPATSPNSEAAAYLRTARTQFTLFNNVPDQTLMTMAHGACTALRRGVGPRQLAASILATKPTPALQHAYAGLIRNGVDAFCPEQAAKLAAPG